MSLVGTSDPTAALIPPSVAPTAIRFGYRGRGDELFLIWIRNLLLTLVTLGIYFPWARAEILQYTIGHFDADGDPLSFHGYGRELFRGMIKAFAIYVGVIVAIVLLSLVQELQVFVTILFYGLLLAIGAWAVFGSFRYRLARTSWRGIRFSFHGDRGEFIKMFMLHTVLVLLTLGWGTPLYVTWLRGALVTGSAFGTRRFAFDGRGKDLMRPFVISVLLTLPTVGLSWLWYDAVQRRFLWNATSFDGARFRLAFETRDWFVLQLVNGLLALFTIGLAWPWIMVRTARFLAEHLALEGTIDLAAIRQELQSAPATGEGLAELFDVDLGIG